MARAGYTQLDIAPANLAASGICASQTTAGAADLLLNGTLCSGGLFVIGSTTAGYSSGCGGIKLLIDGADANNSAIVFTVYGKDPEGKDITETVTGVTATAVSTTKFYSQGALQAIDLPGGIDAVDEGFHLLVDGFFGLAGGNAAVQVNLAGRGHSIQRGSRAGDAGEGQAAAERVFLREAGAKLFDPPDNLSHGINSIGAFFWGGTVCRDPAGRDCTLGFALVPQGDLVRGWLTDDHSIRTEPQRPEEVFEVFALAIFLEHRAGDVNGLPSNRPDCFASAPAYIEALEGMEKEYLRKRQ